MNTQGKQERGNNAGHSQVCHTKCLNKSRCCHLGFLSYWTLRKVIAHKNSQTCCFSAWGYDPKQVVMALEGVRRHEVRWGEELAAIFCQAGSPWQQGFLTSPACQLPLSHPLLPPHRQLCYPGVTAGSKIPQRTGKTSSQAENMAPGRGDGAEERQPGQCSVQLHLVGWTPRLRGCKGFNRGRGRGELSVWAVQPGTLSCF